MILEKNDLYLPLQLIENVDIGLIADQLEQAWKLLGETSPAPVSLLLAFWGLSTDWGKAPVYNYNWSLHGLEHKPHHHWTMTACSEWLTIEQYKAFKQKPGRELVSQDNGPNTKKLTVSGLKYLYWFEPPHALTKRIAFVHSIEGIFDYIYTVRLMYGSIARLWDVIKAGDVSGVCNLIKHYRLTTASVETITNRLFSATRKAKIAIATHKRQATMNDPQPHSYSQHTLNWYASRMHRLRKNGDRT